MATATANAGWTHAVPLDETNGFAQPQRADTMRSHDSRQSGFGRSASSRRPSDYNIQSDSEATGTRRASIRANNASNFRKQSRSALREDRKKAQGNTDDSAWIHRDKLAEIEIREMEELGVHVRQSRRSTSVGPDGHDRASRSMSRSGTHRRKSRDRDSEYLEEPLNPHYSSFDDFSKRKRVSAIPAAEDEDEVSFDPNVDSELRTPEEIAAERAVYKRHMIRPSTSRIPISKVSPVPMPQTVVDRDSPLPRSRHGSGRWSGNWDELQYARRARSGSIGSQVLLDDLDGAQIPSYPPGSHAASSNENSPPKARMPSKSAPRSGARKTSGVNGTARPGSSHMNKARATSTARQREPSGSGHKPRPSTGHAPEGEAPWIASMYKPDPRLPQDQQILPTHAKRMMQEQWERDGKTGTAYDRDLNLLNDTQWQQQQQQQQQQHQQQQPGAQALTDQNHWPHEHTHTHPTRSSPNDQTWPLAPTYPSSPIKPDEPKRPGASSGGGGYKITPTITTPPPIQRTPTIPATTTTAEATRLHDNRNNNNNSTAAAAAAAAAPMNATPRLPDFDEKELPEPKKGCCCIVM
ncbi:hypothetical protein B0A50_07004 [Salinomyces thailandicus]|uniref:TeaA receptor TeaR n=1 Tax=Salinomyces thailandicus TaxID=706561 RepID=A0A4V6WJN8_9PEZI|nr:hypothetical protein B0A50_07004 [Salinomyces thailandica]